MLDRIRTRALEGLHAPIAEPTWLQCVTAFSIPFLIVLGVFTNG